jgi:hypothetical protein
MNGRRWTLCCCKDAAANAANSNFLLPFARVLSLKIRLTAEAGLPYVTAKLLLHNHLRFIRI